eukprot:m.54560 g.54560  ORF g.54560 m.54560 type:complete len:383 (-) comp10935_c0_seq1:62-1210(-)
MSVTNVWDGDVSDLVFHKNPLSTGWYSLIVIKNFAVRNIVKTASAKWFRFFVLPLGILWTVLANIEGSHSEIVAEATLNLRFTLWWFLLGVLSSIGLGSGMHTGMVFLFPHILKVVYTAEDCRSLNFDSRENIWFNPKISATDIDFDCDVMPDNPMPTFMEMYMKVIVACLIWGIGTAVGEIPPYEFSYMAAVAGEHNEELQNELEGSKHEKGDGFVVRQFKSMKAWMIDFIKRHGFLGVYLMAAWPNAAFDLCGMCCGHFKMEFWTFFGATLLGKAFTLRPIQTALFVASFSRRFRPKMIEAIGSMVPVVGTPIATMVNDKISDFIKQTASGEDTSPTAGYFAMAWGSFIIFLVGYFIKTSLEAFAQELVINMKREKAKKQ